MLLMGKYQSINICNWIEYRLHSEVRCVEALNDPFSYRCFIKPILLLVLLLAVVVVVVVVVVVQFIYLASKLITPRTDNKR